MSQYYPCRVCGKTAYLETSAITLLGQTLNPKNWKYYCSKVCRYEDNWITLRYISYIFLSFGVITFLWGPSVLNWTILFGSISLIFFLIGNSRRNYAKRGGPIKRKPAGRSRLKRKVPRKRSIDPETLTPVKRKVELAVTKLQKNSSVAEEKGN